jgi:hypothetical protein
VVAGLSAGCSGGAGSPSSAAARWHDLVVPYEEAQALLGQGRCLMALGRTQEAAQPLEQAWEIFVGLGAKPALEEAEEWLVQSVRGLTVCLPESPELTEPARRSRPFEDVVRARDLGGIRQTVGCVVPARHP